MKITNDLHLAAATTTTFLLTLCLAAQAQAQDQAQDQARAQDDANTTGVPIPELPEFDTSSDETYGRQLAEYADRYDSGWKDAYSKSKMTLHDAGGDSVTRETVQILLEREEGDKSINRFLSPAEIKGVAALTHENPDAVDDSWLYLPASKRVRRISGANRTASFQGTEFTYEDLSNLVVRKYQWRSLGEETLQSDGEDVVCHKLEAVPNYTDTAYSKLVVYYTKNDWRRVRIDFHDKAGRLLKQLEQSKWTKLHGRFWRPLWIEMRNVQTKKRTVIDIELQLLDMSQYKSRRTGEPRPNLTDAQFTTRALERG